MDMNFLGNINSIYALIGVVLMLSFQMWSKAREDKRYREDRSDADRERQEEVKQQHKETLEATNKAIDAQMQQTEAIIESLNRNNEITDLNIEHIIDIAETLDKKHRIKKSGVYKDKYKKTEDKHKKKLC